MLVSARCGTVMLVSPICKTDSLMLMRCQTSFSEVC